MKGLIAMRKAGLLAAVHADQGLLAIEMPGAHPEIGERGVKRRITWAAAERLVEEFHETQRVKKKGPERAAIQVPKPQQNERRRGKS